MATKQKKSVKSKKANQKPQKAAKPSKASKPTPKAAKPQNAAQTPQKANPEDAYRAGGSYHAVVAALRELGVGKFHDRDDVLKAFRKAMGENWDAFAKRDARNDNGKDAEGRAWQNVAVVARPDYGAKLRERGFVVAFDGREKKAGLFPLVK